MHTNLENRRALNSAHAAANGGRVLDEWPELLKVVVESGQHLLVIGSCAERRKIAEEVRNLLEEILRVCHRLQRPAVMHMVAHVHMEMGKIWMDDSETFPDAEDRAKEALPWFAKSLTIAEELSKQSGEHSLVSPMMMVATTLSVLHQYDRALPMFRQAIALAERHLGVAHESLAQMLLNYGVACFEHEEYEAAQVALTRLWGILRVHGYLVANADKDSSAGSVRGAGTGTGDDSTPLEAKAAEPGVRKSILQERAEEYLGKINQLQLLHRP
jgi:tetratricopeptide (TPR) repeat protein